VKNKVVPIADVAIFAISGVLLYALGSRTNLILLQALGGLLIGLALASFLVGFSVLHYLRTPRQKR
jgi:hypothetical protein